MNCLVERLKASVNKDLPVFQSVVLKDYATTSVDNQYVDLSSIVSLLKFNEFRYIAFDAEFLIVDKTATMAAFNTRNHFIGSALLSENVRVGELAGNRNTSQTVSASNNTLYAVTYRPERTGNTYIVKTSINDDEYTSTDYLMGGIPAQNYNINNICAFGYSTNLEFTTFTSKAGALKLKSIKIYDYYNDVSYSKIAELVPAIVNGISCLYDTINEQTYTPNTGSLIVE